MHWILRRKVNFKNTLIKADHDKVGTFEISLRKKSVLLPAYILTGALSDMCPVKRRERVPTFVMRCARAPRLSFINAARYQRGWEITLQHKVSQRTSQIPDISLLLLCSLEIGCHVTPGIVAALERPTVLVEKGGWGWEWSKVERTACGTALMAPDRVTVAALRAQKRGSDKGYFVTSIKCPLLPPQFRPVPTSPQCSRVLRAPSGTVAFTRRVSRPLVCSHHKHPVRRRLAISRHRPFSALMFLAALDFTQLPHSAIWLPQKTDCRPSNRCDFIGSWVIAQKFLQMPQGGGGGEGGAVTLARSAVNHSQLPGDGLRTGLPRGTGGSSLTTTPRAESAHSARTPCERETISAFEVQKRGDDKGDAATHIKCGIATTHRTLNWRAVFYVVIKVKYKHLRNRGGVVVRLLASHLGEPGSIPGGVAPGILACENRAGLCPWSAGFLALLRIHLTSPSSALKTLMPRKWWMAEWWMAEDSCYASTVLAPKYHAFQYVSKTRLVHTNKRMHDYTNTVGSELFCLTFAQSIQRLRALNYSECVRVLQRENTRNENRKKPHRIVGIPKEKPGAVVNPLLPASYTHTLAEDTFIWLPPQIEFTPLFDPTTRNEATRVVNVCYWFYCLQGVSDKRRSSEHVKLTHACMPLTLLLNYNDPEMYSVRFWTTETDIDHNAVVVKRLQSETCADTRKPDDKQINPDVHYQDFSMRG
ncbi:hypothetical protein PR048_029212 [Dryococelus australis]|uniref:Uncharacterized protein n=1 Tax=Dryococelus australis TaxID=614101 RepID=A0ABQ9GG07_9NEOP|nr:hypothetical protein PR048_029212 [Dryococelus australis]